jgi:hypothetical protein
MTPILIKYRYFKEIFLFWGDFYPNFNKILVQILALRTIYNFTIIFHLYRCSNFETRQNCLNFLIHESWVQKYENLIKTSPLTHPLMAVWNKQGFSLLLLKHSAFSQSGAVVCRSFLDSNLSLLFKECRLSVITPWWASDHNSSFIPHENIKISSKLQKKCHLNYRKCRTLTIHSSPCNSFWIPSQFACKMD